MTVCTSVLARRRQRPTAPSGRVHAGGRRRRSPAAGCSRRIARKNALERGCEVVMRSPCNRRAGRRRRAPPDEPRARLPHAHLRPPPRRARRGRIGSSLDGAVAAVELARSRSARRSGDEPGARLLGLVDHFPLALAERRSRVALKHPQVAADDRRRRPELVDGERQQLRVRRLQPTSRRHVRSVAQRSPDARRARQLYENSFRATLNRIRRCAASLKNFPKSAVAHHLKCGCR